MAIKQQRAVRNIGIHSDHRRGLRRMLQGFSVPLSATGRSSLVPSPPWHYAGHVLAIEFWCDPQAIAAHLPKELHQSAEPGYAVAHFAEWQGVSEGADELWDPVRCQYSEFFVTVGARLDGVEVLYCPFIYVDQDVALLRGWIQGLPKKWGAVRMTRSYGVASSASPVEGAGGRFGASLALSDRRAVDARFSATDPGGEPIGFVARPMAGFRHFPDLSRAGREVPLAANLVRFAGSNLDVQRVLQGTAELAFHPTPYDELSDLAPTRIGRACRYSVGVTVDDVTVVT